MYPFAKEEEQVSFVDLDSVLPRLKYEGPYKKDIDIADFYGFRLMRPVSVGREDRDAHGPSDKVALIRAYLERGLDGCTGPAQVCHTEKVPYKQELRLSLNILGTEESVAEALLLKTAGAILAERGVKQFSVSINSMGDRETFEEFAQEFVAHCKKHAEELDAGCRQALKDNPFEVFACANDTCRQVAHTAPPAIQFLKNESKRHFYEVLETLDMFDIPYTIANHLVGDKEAVTRTIFEILEERGEEHVETEEASVSTPEPKTVLARCERYDHISKRSGLGRHIPGIGLTFYQPRAVRSAREQLAEYKKSVPRKPVAYIVQLGSHAKHQTLTTLEDLRLAGVPVALTITENSLKTQLALAEDAGAPAIVIIGHKEAVEGTAIVRNRETREQIIIPRSDLPRALKRIRV